MSIMPPGYTDGNEIDFKYEDLAIGGKMITAAINVSEMEIANSGAGFKDHLRDRLATALAKAMFEKGLIEFTQLKDPAQFNTRVMARCYLAPNDQVKLLRVNVTSKVNK